MQCDLRIFEPKSLLCLFLLGAAACSFGKRFSRATIQSGHIGWSVVEGCVDLNCYPHADFLIGREATIRVEALNYLLPGIRDSFFLVSVMFPDDKYANLAFDPSDAAITFSNGNTLTPKGIRCARTVIDRRYFSSVPPVSGFQRVTADEYCYYLFFDVPPPSVEDTFVLRLNGVRRDGQRIQVPDIIFRPGNR
jgi:hypothetical protein